MNFDPTNSIPLHASLRAASARPPVALRPPAVTGTPVAARVSAAPEFESSSVPKTPGNLSMYTRAADRIEAAIESQLGRRVDIRA